MIFERLCQIAGFIWFAWAFYALLIAILENITGARNARTGP